VRGRVSERLHGNRHGDQRDRPGDDLLLKRATVHTATRRLFRA
jgi:hypothetical protein